MTDLDPAAVRAFVAAVDEGQFSHAADVLGITQQAVSKRIAKLESQFEVALFDRGPGGITVTDAGNRLLPYARSLLAVIDEAVAAVRGRPLRVAVLGERQPAMELMRYYLDRNPDCDTEVVLSNLFATSRDAVATGRADAAFARPFGGPRPLPLEIDAAPAYLEPLHLLVGRGHPLAARSTITLAEASAYPAWVPGASVPSEWADYYRNLAEFSGVVVETGDRPEPMDPILRRVAASEHLTTFTGEGFLTPLHPAIRRLRIVDPTPAYPHALLWSRANTHPALPRLIAHFRATYNGDIAPHCWVPDADRALFTG
ncbi:LysR family transcriptional regulator [Nocardia pseudobrasiliensis]|uniref:DNA-binding transcriptional LysR family regulator n=1 Tax=Nocardia pseudobrasiliensis TaxID=45979 RepID=A0A370IA05_9NOCA|nr:LysR family transcriptional regulator [Nocardia pseudobrasiliensis]RDI67542.1 DNA-binding transcriptional LysR family regulator [Nocardia pseudobrasiliensis]